ncbi:MAG: hypothetical protein QOG68_79 [Solirubrobacteraceae bacterium]|nr:hypothetical protein [Solirubrobacteraceae bacterium]
MGLHPLAAQFAGVAEVYERGRPGYAPAVVGALSAELGLAPGARVLDLAAGTGKLTRALVGGGLDVVAVEPLAELRAVLEATVGAERVVEGVAEAIPLPDASVDAVTVADAFHWFDAEPALAEIGRVLRPGGGLALLSTAPDWRDAPWGHELGTLIADMRTEHPYFDGTPWQQTLAAAPGFGVPRDVQVITRQETDPERIAAYVQSMSWVAAMEPDVRAGMLARIAELTAGDGPRNLRVRVFMWLSVRG